MKQVVSLAAALYYHTEMYGIAENTTDMPHWMGHMPIHTCRASTTRVLGLNHHTRVNDRRISTKRGQ